MKRDVWLLTHYHVRTLIFFLNVIMTNTKHLFNFKYNKFNADVLISVGKFHMIQ